ncbi:MAG: hypothetical protein K2F72_05075, partial [Muribaculaceae bacterium]|nr:hypothetical protein [Muribaculaceae bacterium]
MHLRRRLTLGLLAALLGGPALVVRAGDGDAVPAPAPDSLEVAAPDSLPAPGPDSLTADTTPVAALQDALINRPRPETETITPARSRIVKERVD